VCCCVFMSQMVKSCSEFVVIVVLEAHVTHIVDGLVHRVQCFLVVSGHFILSVN